MNKILFLKRIDAMLGPLLVQLTQLLFSARNMRAEHVHRILFIRPGGIGDAVLLIPAIKSVKKRFPSSTIHVLAEKRNAEIFKLCPDIERIMHYDKPVELIAAIRGLYDVVIDAEQMHRLSAVVARMVRSPMSVGFATNERSRLFTHTVPYAHDDHEIGSFVHLIEPLIGKHEFDADSPFLTVPEAYHANIGRILARLSGRKIISLFPGASIAERRWGIDRFYAVAKEFSKRGWTIVVIGGKGDVMAGEQIVRDMPAALNLCSKLSLPETAAVLERSALLVSADSGIMHLGYAVGTRGVALFGPGIEKKWAPRSSRVAVINKKLPCSPCTKFGYTPRCRINAECMRQISVDDVMTAAILMLEKT